MTSAPDAPTLVDFQQLLDGIAEASEHAARAAGLSWLGAPVPTCPGWSLLDLLAHLGTVHRWAVAAVTGDEATFAAPEHVETEGRTHADPLAWLRHGSAELEAALAAAPADLAARTFLKEAPAPREFWARRQCHETTIHALDAIAALEERFPVADDAWFGAELAADGIDELLRGFWQRSRSGPRSEVERAVLVTLDDLDLGWLVTTTAERCVVERLAPVPESLVGVDARVRGGAVDLYLALWNRGGSVSDPDGVLAEWAEPGAIRWG